MRSISATAFVLCFLFTGCIESEPPEGSDPTDEARVTTIDGGLACDGTEHRIGCAIPDVSPVVWCAQGRDLLGLGARFFVSKCNCWVSRPGSTCGSYGLESCYGTSCPAMAYEYTAWQRTIALLTDFSYRTEEECETASEDFCRAQCDAHATEGIGPYVEAMYCQTP